MCGKRQSIQLYSPFAVDGLKVLVFGFRGKDRSSGSLYAANTPKGLGCFRIKLSEVKGAWLEGCSCSAPISGQQTMFLATKNIAVGKPLLHKMPRREQVADIA